MLKISAQLNDRDFQGTAEELATFVSEKLAELGFGERHRSSERLVRFYAYQKLLSRPEKAPDDGRQRLFGQLQVRQLLLARLLAERGWDLDRIRTLLLQNQEITSLNKLIDELATPTEAEKLFFRTRSSAAGVDRPRHAGHPDPERRGRLAGLPPYQGRWRQRRPSAWCDRLGRGHPVRQRGPLRRSCRRHQQPPPHRDRSALRDAVPWAAAVHP